MAMPPLCVISKFTTRKRNFVFKYILLGRINPTQPNTTQNRQRQDDPQPLPVLRLANRAISTNDHYRDKMLRGSAGRLLLHFSRPAAGSAAAGNLMNSRTFSTDLAAAAPEPDQVFVDAWKKVAPNIDPPKTPLSFMKPRPPVPSSIPPKLTVNFYLPYSPELSGKEVDMVIIPATTGQMGVLPGHVGTMAELKPGIVSVHEGNDVSKYFVSGGFAFIHPNSVTDIVAVEAVPIDRIDPSQVQKGLSEFTQKLSSASADYEKAEAQIGVDVYSALNSALTG